MMDRAGLELFSVKSLLLSMHGVYDFLSVIDGLDTLHIGVAKGCYAGSTDQAQSELVRLLEQGVGHLLSYNSTSRASSLS
jgi:hypothetical protein